MIKNTSIDNGREFDWSRASADYAKYRDIYPMEFYKTLLDMGVGVRGQKILDIGTGTGVIPRNLYRYGADFTGIDIAEGQIEQAVALAKRFDMRIDFQCTSAENANFPDDMFDAVTACQCFTYFSHHTLAPLLHRLLKPNGRLVVLYMAWLPFEDEIAGKSEDLVLQYNPAWTGCKEERHAIAIPAVYQSYFTVEQQEVFDLQVPFIREGWNGRMKSCRGIGASLSQEETERFDAQHMRLLEKIAPEEFQVLHYAAVTCLRKKERE